MYISIYIPWKSKGQTKHIVPRKLGVVRWNFTSKKWHCVDMHLTKNLGSSELRSSGLFSGSHVVPDDLCFCSPVFFCRFRPGCYMQNSG